MDTGYLEETESLVGVVGQTIFRDTPEGIVVLATVRETASETIERNIAFGTAEFVSIIRDFWREQPEIENDVVPDDAELVRVLFNGNYHISVMSEEFLGLALSEVAPTVAEVYSTSPVPLGVDQTVVDETAVADVTLRELDPEDEPDVEVTMTNNNSEDNE